MSTATIASPDEPAFSSLHQDRAAAPTTSPAQPSSPPRSASSPAPTGAAFARTLFRIPFGSAMSDDDAHRLHDALDMTLHLQPKHPAVRPPLGVTTLPFGGLFLVRDDGEDRWALECRAWCDPAPEMVRACRLEAMFAARLLDPRTPTVT